MKKEAMEIMNEIEKKMDATEYFCDIHPVVMGTLMKGHSFEKAGYAEFKNSGLLDRPAERTGFWNSELGLFVILELSQDWEDFHDENGMNTRYESYRIAKVEFYDEYIEDLEFAGDIEPIFSISSRRKLC